METKLLPCPFCGTTEANPLEHKTDCFHRMFYEMMLPHGEVFYPEEKLRKAWNTRHEQSVKLWVSRGHDGLYRAYCPDCGCEVGNFCPDCGARVTE